MSRNRLFRFVNVAFALALAPQAAFAATICNWTNNNGSGDGTWEDTANWAGGGPPIWNNNSSSGTGAYFNGPSGTVTLSTTDQSYSVTFDSLAAGTTIAANAGGVLSCGTGGINAANLTSGTVTITAPVTLSTNSISYWNGAMSAGALAIAGPVLVNGGVGDGLYLNSGNFEITTGGTLENTSSYFVLNKSIANPTNIQQTGGYVYSGRGTQSTNADIYLSQGQGGCNYTISGGTLAVKTGGSYIITVGYQNVSGPSTLNITGNGVVTTPVLELNCSTIGNSAGKRDGQYARRLAAGRPDLH